MRRRSLPTMMTLTLTLGVAMTLSACGRDDARDQRTEGAPAGIDRPMGTGDPGAAPMGTAGVNVNVTGCLERADDGAGTWVLTQVRQDQGGVGTTGQAGQAGREGTAGTDPMMAGMERLRLAPATTEDLGRHEGQRVSITGRLEQHGMGTDAGAVGTGAGTGTGQGTGARPGATGTDRDRDTGATGAGMGAAPGTMGAGASLLHVESIRDTGEQCNAGGQPQRR
jgi:hypothetical protein